MELGLKGRRVAILASDAGDAAQLAELRQSFATAGAVAEIVGVRSRDVSNQSASSLVERTVDTCHAADFDALVIAGGRASIGALRAESKAVHFVREFMAADKPVAAMADGVAMVAAADAATGRAVAASGQVAEDVRAAGAEVVDAGVHVDDKLITARDGRDLTSFTDTILREFANRVDEARVDQMSEQSFPASDPPPGPVAVGGGGASELLHLDPRRGSDSEQDDQAARA